jgi:hypothetical protein
MEFVPFRAKPNTSVLGLISTFLLFFTTAACQSLPVTIPQPGTPQPTAAEPTTEAPILGEIGGPTVAFVRDQALYIQQGDVALPAETCAESGCRVYHLTWSPDGEQLAYLWQPADGSTPEIRMVNLTGEVQTVAQGAAYLQPVAWSPQGNALAYLIGTDRFEENTGGPGVNIFEVWTAEVAADGAIANATQRGELGFGVGCGGGGGSESGTLYETEGGFAFGYLASILEWTAEDLLLFSNNCTSRGVGRFDLNGGTELEPYPGGLRSLSLNATGDAWVAIDDQERVVRGTPGSLEVEPITTQAAPELVFAGADERLYYTTWTQTGSEDLSDMLQLLGPSIMVSPFFDFREATLRLVDPAAQTETVLLADDAYAYARVAEATDGVVYVSRVEASTRLYEAFQGGSLTAETVQDLRPTVDVLRLTPGGAPEVWISDATQFTLTPVP